MGSTVNGAKRPRGPVPMAALGVSAFALAIAAAAQGAGARSIDVIVPTPNDESSGVSPALTYTHLVDFNSDDGGATINGVTFPAGGAAGTNYTLTGAANVFQNHNSPAPDGSGLDDLLDDFFYGGNPGTLTLTGLTPRVPYRLRMYVGGFGGSLQGFFVDDGNPTPAVELPPVPRNGGSDATAASLDVLYTLPAGRTHLVVSATPVDPAHTFHWYGFSNEVVPEPGSLGVLAAAALGLLTRRRREA